MKYSIVICSRNRSASLKDTLTAFSLQTKNNPVDHEIIVVDNASTDKTKDVVHDLTANFNGRLHYYCEERIGIPFARNRGIKESSGDVIVFVDDDCIPADNYIQTLEHLFDGFPETVGFIGGKIDPLFEGGAKLPEWFAHNYDFFWGPLAILNYGNQPFTIGKEQLMVKDRLFYSANLAVKKELFEKYGGISENKMLAGDTDLCLRLLAAGILGGYEPRLTVHHRINKKRLAPSTYRRWFYLRGQYRDLSFHYEKKFFYPFGIPTWLFKNIVTHFLRSLLTDDFAERLRLQCWSSYFCGQAVKIMRKIGVVNNQFPYEITGH